MEFPLHAYLKRLGELGASSEYIAAVRRNAKPLADRQLPVILSLGHLAHATNVPTVMLTNIVGRKTDPYRVFSIRKRSGGKRFICVPEPSLLYVQRWIHEQVLCSPFAVGEIARNATAYAPDSSHVINARRHIGAEWIIKIDIKSFFESISERQVYRVFRNLGYRALVAFCLTRLCTRAIPGRDYRQTLRVRRWAPGGRRLFLGSSVVGHLPQGAPTSPMLANLVCIGMDSKLQSIADEHGLTYSRYADDMTFSGTIVGRQNAQEIAREVSAVVSKYGFRINDQKTSISKSGARKIVTGLSVDGDDVRLPRSYKDAIRQELYYLEKYGVSEHCKRIGQRNNLAYLLRLAGRIRYARLIEPVLGGRMWEKFSSITPDILDLERLSGCRAEKQ